MNMTDNQFADAYASAKQGHRITYFIGELSRECEIQTDPQKRMATLGVRKIVARYSDEKRVYLTQEPVGLINKGPRQFRYYATKARTNQCKPGIVFGEQVASKDGLAWLDLVQADLEGQGYANAALDMCSAGFSAPTATQSTPNKQPNLSERPSTP